jgi:DNA-binding NarL/FixJ family response regulator
MLDFFVGNGANLDGLRALVQSEPWMEQLPLFQRPRFVLGAILKWTDHLDESRDVFIELRNRLEVLGQDAWIPYLTYHLAELECWAGQLDEAEDYARLGARTAERLPNLLETSPVHYAIALVAACRGDEARARHALAAGLDDAAERSNVALALQLTSVAGFLELSLGNLEAVHAMLGPTAQAIASMGLGEPGIVRWLPDEIEALVGLGDLRTARHLTQLLEVSATETGRRWASAAGARCRALVLGADGDLMGARGAAAEALETSAASPYPLERGRAEVVAGEILLRSREVAEARRILDVAVSRFEGIGAPLWAARARAARDRVSGRPPAGDRLTPMEARVAELAAEGCSNREIAERLFVSVRTVESHLSATYRKLGIRSRAQLPRR